MTDTEQLKRSVAIGAAEYVQSGTVLGLGSGTTMHYVLEELGRRLAAGEVQSIIGVPTSELTAEIARRVGIPLTTLAEHPVLDLAIDGADEIDPCLNLTKGRGGALLREKIVAASARELLIVADTTKLVAQLGSRVPLPIEVIPFAQPLVVRRLYRLGGCPEVRIVAGRPFRTDEGNHIIDYACGPIADPFTLAFALFSIPGVVDHGLFLGMAQRALIAGETGLRVVEPDNARQFDRCSE